MFCRKLKLFHLGLIVHASVPVNVNVDELCTVGGWGGGGVVASLLAKGLLVEEQSGW